MDSLITVLTSGSLIVGVVSVMRWILKTKGVELSAIATRWTVYGLAFLSTVIAAAISKEINFSFVDPEVFITTVLGVFATAETLYRVVAGKLGLGIKSK